MRRRSFRPREFVISWAAWRDWASRRPSAGSSEYLMAMTMTSPSSEAGASVTRDDEILAVLLRIADALDRLVPPPCETQAADPRLERLADLLGELVEMGPGERAKAIQERMSLSKTSYYRLRAALIESLEQSHQSHVASGTAG